MQMVISPLKELFFITPAQAAFPIVAASASPEVVCLLASRETSQLAMYIYIYIYIYNAVLVAELSTLFCPVLPCGFGTSQFGDESSRYFNPYWCPRASGKIHGVLHALFDFVGVFEVWFLTLQKSRRMRICVNRELDIAVHQLSTAHRASSVYLAGRLRSEPQSACVIGRGGRQAVQSLRAPGPTKTSSLILVLTD